MIYPIYIYGSQVLRQKAQPADTEDREGLSELLANMIETMKNADGCGLAAPQVGISRRVLVVDGNELRDRFPELEGFHREMINPEVTFRSEETSQYSEGCLSIPDLDADIVRPRRIRVSYINADFKQVEEEFDDFASRMIQHELDHLDGILYTDHASPIRKKLIAAKLVAIQKGKVKTSYRVKSDKK